MGSNPFEVQVFNPLQALMLGKQSYDSAIENNKKQAIEQARAQAGQQYAAGDTKGALATLLMGNDLQGAGTYSGLDQNAWTRSHTEKQDAVNAQHWGADYAIRRAAEGRAAKDFENTPDQYVPNPRASESNQPAFIDQYAAARTSAESGGGKPIPYDTLGGTKFLMPQPGGGYLNVDPRTIAAGTPVPSSAKVVGDTEGVARGLYDQPQAPGQRPPLQVAQNQLAQGQPAQPADPNAVDPTTGRREGFLQTLDPQIQGYIKKIADYEIDPRTTSVKGGMRERLMSAVAQYDPTYDQNTFGARAKAVKDFGTGKEGGIVRSFNVAIDHLDLLSKAATALENGDTRIFNEIRNKWREQTGSDLPTNFNALKPLVSGEIAKAAIGSNNALADREELRAPLVAASSSAQFNGVIKSYKGLMAGQVRGLKKQYEDSTGRKDFERKLFQSTINELGLHSGEGQAKGGVVIDGYTIKEN